MSAIGKTVFVTGGAGYIGSHCVCELLSAGYQVVAVDNFANSVEGGEKAPSLDRVERITGKKVTFYRCDLLDKPRLEEIFNEHKIDLVIHFAATKAVGESMLVPLLYYKNNLFSTLNLLDVMSTHDVHTLVFSSSSTVYGQATTFPITESHPTGNVLSVYGRTKHFVEKILEDVANSDKKWNIVALRYFNPVGAHPSGLIGEDATKLFTNLMPFLAKVASGQEPHLNIFGGDYDTVDGTGVRDYIHVMDLVAGHVAALKKLSSTHLGFKAYNLGRGHGVSVRQMAALFAAASGRPIPCVVQPRRLGDVATTLCSPALANAELDWRATRDHRTMCDDFWRWKTMNPDGYRGALLTNGSLAVANVTKKHSSDTQSTEEDSADETTRVYDFENTKGVHIKQWGA